jgi:NAD(P)-dependent dehydrogenase (short-subunit alcohol dehydrogenase family)
MRMKNMRAVITGGAGGLGLATAQAFLAAGARVLLADIDAPALADVRRSLRAPAQDLLCACCDISDAADCARLIAVAEEGLGGPIDVFVAHAGRPFGGPLAQADPADIRSVIDTNVTGTILSAQAALVSLRRSPRASLLFTGSLQSVLGRAERSVYTASKHAIAGLVKSLALEWGPLGVRVNGIAPTLVDTPFLRQAYAQAGIEVAPALARAAEGLPLGRIPTPEDFAHAAVFLASDEARAITGHLLMVDCGASAGKF